ncbi:MAG: hypothetical protein IJ217_05135 [Clostridia bacterium]|nr:hypothetical protein [Clostridia bacterium]
MYNFLIDVIVWSFAIYGFTNIIKEFWLDAICYIIKKLIRLKHMIRQKLGSLR